MSNPAPDKLLDYLLDACDADERQQIEQHLQQDESLRQHCNLLSKAIEPLACDKAHLEPPKGLAQRCCEFVFSRVELMPAALSPVGGAAAVPVKRRRWSWLDITVAGAVAAAVLFLIAPAIFQARQQALKMTCQNNLKDIGTALRSYSNLHGEMYPMPPQKGGTAYAGMWGSLLKDHLPGEDKLLCPASPSGCETKPNVPSVTQMQAMDDAQVDAKVAPQLRRIYGFTLGYYDGGKYKVHRHQGRPHFAVVSDVPGPRASNSLNHGGLGQNVLFEDETVKFIVGEQPNKNDKNIFSNGKGEVSPGTDPDDAVIVPGHYRIQIYLITP